MRQRRRASPATGTPLSLEKGPGPFIGPFIGEQKGTFLALREHGRNVPFGFLEMPIQGPLPEGLNYIP